MDVGPRSSFLPRKIHQSGGEISPVLPPPVLKMTVNFHPLLQNGCLMINGGLALRPGSHAAPAQSTAGFRGKGASGPAEEGSRSKGGCFLE